MKRVKMVEKGGAALQIKKRKRKEEEKRGEEEEGAELLEGCAKPEGNGPGKAHRAKKPEEKTEKMEEEERRARWRKVDRNEGRKLVEGHRMGPNRKQTFLVF